MMFWEWERRKEVIESEDGRYFELFMNYRDHDSGDDSSDSGDDVEVEEDEEESREPNLAHQGPTCHEENWEEPVASELCRICLRKQDQPPPLDVDR